ncbi:Menaquinone-specific isochorismate synthase [Serratia fonticola]|uniref:Menaquinone-specific isochorismate synthase n=1 Tax=Serratia fonticola TaxID=47917 RepID=A0A4U9VZ26_SERFO|nr:Menaquinone-specific isochorismate synthase [Serratia fonticola]
MEQLSGLLRRLRQQLGHDFPREAGFRQLTLVVPGHLSDLLLEWLAAQVLFPQFYWRHREGRQEAAVCGALRQFSQPSMAQAFVNAYPAARLWGLTAFER